MLMLGTRAPGRAVRAVARGAVALPRWLAAGRRPPGIARPRSDLAAAAAAPVAVDGDAPQHMEHHGFGRSAASQLQAALQAGDMAQTVQLLQSASETAAALPFLPADVFEAALRLAVSLGDMDAADRIIALLTQSTMADGANRFTAEVARLYATLAARLPLTEMARGFGFVELALEFGQDALPAFISALFGAHGELGVTCFVEFAMGKGPLALDPELAVNISVSLHGLNSPLIIDFFPVALEAITKGRLHPSDIVAAEQWLLRVDKEGVPRCEYLEIPTPSVGAVTEEYIRTYLPRRVHKLPVARMRLSALFASLVAYAVRANQLQLAFDAWQLGKREYSCNSHLFSTTQSNLAHEMMQRLVKPHEAAMYKAVLQAKARARREGDSSATTAADGVSAAAGVAADVGAAAEPTPVAQPAAAALPSAHAHAAGAAADAAAAAGSDAQPSPVVAMIAAVEANAAAAVAAGDYAYDAELTAVAPGVRTAASTPDVLPLAAVLPQMELPPSPLRKPTQANETAPGVPRSQHNLLELRGAIDAVADILSGMARDGSLYQSLFVSAAKYLRLAWRSGRLANICDIIIEQRTRDRLHNKRIAAPEFDVVYAGLMQEGRIGRALALLNLSLEADQKMQTKFGADRPDFVPTRRTFYALMDAAVRTRNEGMFNFLNKVSDAVGHGADGKHKMAVATLRTRLMDALAGRVSSATPGVAEAAAAAAGDGATAASSEASSSSQPAPFRKTLYETSIDSQLEHLRSGIATERSNLAATPHLAPYIDSRDINPLLIAYIRIGRTAKALSVSEWLLDQHRIAVHPSTIAVLASGLSFSGGRTVTQLSPSRVPVALGGTMPQAAVDSLRRELSKQMSAVSRKSYDPAPSSFIGEDAAQQLRVAGVNAVVQGLQYLALRYAGLVVSRQLDIFLLAADGVIGARASKRRNAMAALAKLANFGWYTPGAGWNLMTAYLSFQCGGPDAWPFASTLDAALTRLEQAAEVTVLDAEPGEDNFFGSADAGNAGAGVATVDGAIGAADTLSPSFINARAVEAQLKAEFSFKARGEHDSYNEAWASASALQREDASTQSAGYTFGTAVSSTGVDFLPRLPSLLQRLAPFLEHRGEVAAHDQRSTPLRMAAEEAVISLHGLLPPARTLQLLLELCRGGAFSDAPMVTRPARGLLGDMVAVDFREAAGATSWPLLRVLLSQLAVGRVLHAANEWVAASAAAARPASSDGKATPIPPLPPCPSLVVLPRGRRGAFGHVSEALRCDLHPPLPAVSSFTKQPGTDYVTSASLYLPAADVQRWCDANVATVSTLQPVLKPWWLTMT